VYYDLFQNFLLGPVQLGKIGISQGIIKQGNRISFAIAGCKGHDGREAGQLYSSRIFSYNGHKKNRKY
jgi:hypothetical protein